MVSLRFLLRLSVVTGGATLAVLTFTVDYVWVFTVLVLFLAFRGQGPALWAHGTARWADWRDYCARGMIGATGGLPLGVADGTISRRDGLRALFARRLQATLAVQLFLRSFRKKPPPLKVQLTDVVHLAVFAPSGAGKNVAIVEPLLLTSRENFFVTDIKGENAQITAAYRKRVFGHKIVLLDPFKLVTATPATFNVLDTIDPADPECFDQGKAIAEAIVDKEPNSKEPHWRQKAVTYIAGTIAGIIHLLPPDRRSLQEVVEILADKTLLALLIKRMQSSTVHEGLLARLGHEMSICTDRELDGVLSTAHRFLSFLSTPAVVESIRPVSEDTNTIKFQFTQESREGDHYEYKLETTLTLNKQTGTVTCELPGLATVAQEELDRCIAVRTGGDITKVVQKLFERRADLFPIRPQGGCYFCPACHVAFIDKIQDLLNRVGGRLLRFPVPAGTNEGDRSVTQAVADGLAAVVAEHRSAVAQFGTDTRDDTLQRAAEKIRTTKFKLAAYAEYLVGEKDRLDRAVADAERELREKVERIAGATAEPAAV